MSERTAKRLWNRVVVERQKSTEGRSAQGLHISEAKAGMCLWIAGSGRDGYVCAAPTVPGRSWCPDHLRRVMAG
jgi:hypothetical protein